MKFEFENLKIRGQVSLWLSKPVSVNAAYAVKCKLLKCKRSKCKLLYVLL